MAEIIYRKAHLIPLPTQNGQSPVLAIQKDTTMTQFAPHDKFYLALWAHNLKYHFSFLDKSMITHGYQLFYFLCKLSYLFGVKYADYSLSYESVLDEPDKQLAHLFSRLDIENYNIDALRSLIVKPRRDEWKAYADDEWFRGHETTCETVMVEYFEKSPIMAVSSGSDRCSSGSSEPLSTVRPSV